MGAAVTKQANSATKGGISRLQSELHPELWQVHMPSQPEAPNNIAHGKAGEPGPRVRGGRSAAGGGDDDDDNDDDDRGEEDLLGELPADVDYASLATGYASSSDEEVDVESDAKVARVRKLMEFPIAEAAAGSRVPDRQIRTMLAEAHRRCQSMDMLDFVHECKRRLEEKDDLPRASAGRRGAELKLPRSHIKEAYALQQGLQQRQQR
jgi:hypothetical protein